MIDLDSIDTVGDLDGEDNPGTTSTTEDKGTANKNEEGYRQRRHQEHNLQQEDMMEQPQDLRYFLDRGRLFRNRYRN